MQEQLSNIVSPFLVSLLVSMGIGLIVGMQREFENLSGKEHFTGLRGFSIMSVLGCVIAFIAVKFNASILLFVAPAILIFVSVFHYSKSMKENFGIVTELSLILVFFLGVLTGLEYTKEALAVAVIVSTLLTLKDKFNETIQRITTVEFYAFIKFIIIALLIIPFLPDQNFGPGDVINPLGIGIAMLFVSILSFIGYFVIKFFGAEKGILFSAFFGGTVSSTAVTWVFSNRSRESETLSVQYANGIIIACGVMFLRVLLVSGVFNMAIFKMLLLPTLFMMICTIIVILVLRRRTAGKSRTNSSIQLGNPLEVSKVLLFGLLYVGITLIVYYANIYLDIRGLYLTGFIAGLADVDAINISVSKLSVHQIDPNTATIVILLAVLSNTLVKIGVAFLRGTQQLRKLVFIGLLPSLLIALSGIGWILFVRS